MPDPIKNLNLDLSGYKEESNPPKGLNLDLSGYEDAQKKKSDSTVSQPKSASVTESGSSVTSGVNPFKSAEIPGQLPTAPTNIAAKPAAKPVSAKKEKEKAKPKAEEDDYSFLDYAADNLGAGVDYAAKSIAELPEMAYDMIRSDKFMDSLDKLTPVVPAGTIARKTLEFLDPTKDKKATAEDIKQYYGIRNIPAEHLKERISGLNKNIEEQNKKYGGDALSAIQNDRYVDAAKMIAGTTIQSLPIMAAAIISGGSTAGNTAIGLSTASQKYAQLKDEHPELSTDKKLANAGTTGLLEATIGTLVEGVSGQAIRNIISNKGAQEGARIVANGFRSMFAKAVEKNPLLGALGEVIEESTVEFGEQLNDMNSGIRKELDFHSIANAGLSAVGMGTVTTVPVYAAKKYSTHKDYKEMKDVNKQIFKLTNELNNPEISETTKTEINKNIDNLVKHNQALVQKSTENIEALHPDVKEKLIESIGTLETLKEKAQAIKDDNSSPETKKMLLANLKQEAKQANVIKDKILKGEATVVDTLPENMQEELKRKAKSEIMSSLDPEVKDKELNEATTEDKVLAKANEIYEKGRPSKAQSAESSSQSAETTLPETTEAALPSAPENTASETPTAIPATNAEIAQVAPQSQPQTITNEATSSNNPPVDGDLGIRPEQLGENRAALEEVIDEKSTQPSIELGKPEESSEIKAEIEHNGTVFTKTIDGNWVNTKTQNQIKGISDKGKALIKSLDEKLGGNLSDVDHAKKEIERGVLNWSGDVGSERVALGITWADIRKGEKDIKAGKTTTAPAKKLIEALKEAKERGGYHYVQGMGGVQSKQFVPLSEVQRASNENSLTDEEIAIINSNEERLAKEFDEYFNSLDEESQNAILDNYENTENKSGKTGSDAKVGEGKDDVSDTETEPRGKNKEERVDSGEDTDVPTTKEPVKEEKSETKEQATETTDNNFEKKKGKRSVLKRASEGNSTTVKQAISKYSLDYEVENQIQAEKDARAFVDEVGMYAALDAVRTNKIVGGTKAFVYQAIIDDLKAKIENAKVDEREDFEDLNREVLGEILVEMAKEGTNAGRFNSALNKIYIGSGGMYNLSKRVADYKAANNGVISDEVLKKFTEADAKIRELEAKLDEMQKEKVKAEEEQSLKDIIEEVARQSKVGKNAQIKSTAKAQAFADKLRSFKTTSLGGAMAATPVSLAYDAAIEIAARTIETSGKIHDAILEGIEYIRNQNISKQEKQEAIAQFSNAFSQSDGEQKPITIGDDGKLKIPHSIIRGHVENGIDTVEDLVEAVQADVNEMFPDEDFTEREVRDAITRYGKTINPTQDEIELEIGRMNSLGRLISGIEDAESGQRPLRSGLQRREATKEERKMQRELRELLRDLPMNDAETAKTWKTALDSIKTRLANEIEQLDDQIAAGEKRKAERKIIELDDEAKGLKEIRDAKRKELDELVGKPELTYEEKVAKAIKNTEDAVAKLQEKIASGDLAYKTKPTPVTSDKLESLRAQKKALEAQIDEMRQDSGLAEMKRLETAKQARKNRIKELKRRIQEKDFSTRKPKPLPVDAEILEIERQLLEQKAIFDKEKYKQELDNQHVFRKWWGRVGNVLGLPRLFKAGGEFSAVLMQTGFLTTEMLVRNPKEVFRSIGMLGKAFSSNTTAQKYETIVKTHPLYPLMQKAKLTLTGTDHRIDATEEAFQLDLVNDTWNAIGEGLNKATGEREILTPLGKLKTMMGKEVTAEDRKMAGDQFKDSNLWKMFERGAVTYSNHMKVLKFEEGVKELEKQGYDPINHFEQYKQLAKYINVFSGRANLGRAEMVSKDLAVVFFSARMAVSQFQQLNPFFYGGLADWSNVKGITSLNKVKSTVAQQMAVKSFVTSFVAITGFATAFMAAANAASDDDEEKWTIETDPRSSDFGKLRKGKFTFDMWHGLGTWAVFFARTLSQQTKKRDSGEISDLGVGRTDAYGDLGVKFVGNKLAPTASYLWKLMLTHPEVDPNTGEVYRVDKYGNVFGEDDTMDLLKPIYWNAIYNIAKEDPDAWQVFLTSIGLFGANTGVEQERVKFKDVTKKHKSEPASRQDSSRQISERQDVSRQSFKRQ